MLNPCRMKLFDSIEVIQVMLLHGLEDGLVNQRSATEILDLGTTR